MKLWNRTMLLAAGLCAAALAACAPPRPSQPAQANWMTDVNKAIETARTEGRPLFIAFLGSDWSTASQGALKDVLDTLAFKEMADDNFVLLKVDFARKGLTPEEAQTYAALAKQLQVDHFPMFLLADPSHGVGTFSRISTYGNGGAVEFVDQIMGVMTEYRQVLASKLAQMQAQASSAPGVPPPPLPQAGGASSFPTPQQMLNQPTAQAQANVPLPGNPVNAMQNPPSVQPSGYPSVQDMLNGKVPAAPAPAPGTSPAGNTDAPAFQLK